MRLSLPVGYAVRHEMSRRQSGNHWDPPGAFQSKGNERRMFFEGQG